MVIKNGVREMIKEVPSLKFKQAFKCRRCGSNLQSKSVFAPSFSGGTTVGHAKIILCSLCLNGDGVIF